MSVLGGMRAFSKIVILSFIALFMAALPASLSAETSLPKPAGPVNDFADVITPPYEKRIGVAVLVSGAAILAFVLYKIYGRSKVKANLGNIQK